MKLLVIDDDRTITQTLQNLLSAYHYAVDTAADGEAGLELIEAFNYDLILLDLILPGLDGVALCKQVRAKGFKMPILLLTGQGETQQKTEALNSGADDYLVKPFDAEELIARVQALLRRGGLKSRPMLSWGKLSLDPSTRQVSYDLQMLSLTPKEFAILELFLRSPQQVFSPEVILNHAWASTESPGEESVRVHIKGLRQKLGAAGAPKDFIKTLHRLGYQLNPLYSEALSSRVTEQPSAPNVAELTSVNQQLRERLERLQTSHDELRQQYEELAIAHRTLEAEQQPMQATGEDSERQRTAESPASVLDHQPPPSLAPPVLEQPSPEQWSAIFDQAFDQAIDAIAILNDEGLFVDVNPAACRLLATSKDVLVSLGIRNFCCPDDDAEQIVAQLMQRGGVSGGWRVCGQDQRLIAIARVSTARLIANHHLLILREESAA